MKNVLFIDTGLSFGGSLVVAARIANEISALGYRSFVVTPVDAALIRHHFNEDVTIINLQKPVTYKDKMELAERLSNIKFAPLRKLLSLGHNILEIFKNTAYTKAIKKIIKDNNIDIIHNNNCYDSIKVAKKLGKKIVWHFHGYLNDSSRTTRKWLSQCDHYIAISQCVYDSAASSDFIASKKMSMLFNPIQNTIHYYSSAEIDARKEELKIGKRFVVGVFGRLVAWKGQLEFLAAFQQVKREVPNAVALLVGDDSEYGGYREQLSNQIEKLQLTNDVIFSGYTTNTDLHYQLCDLVVHCSIKPEPFGLVITEAMQNKVAIIASSHGAGKELVKNKSNGLIADPLNPQELSTAIITLAKDSQTRNNYRDKALEFVETLNAEAYAKQVVDIYNSILD
ncbi:MAG: glycosyltransferase family 4 protein [Gammaproteobacteria bacterium]|nr:glycosyltransferase family 4 protein [Gammaproteobacteria bacterium]